MRRTEDFCQDYRQVVDSLALPDRIALAYRPEACLAERQGPWGEEACRQLGIKLTALLERLHQMDPPIIHRDIKPDNIIIGPDGDVGLIDFGIARQYKPHQVSDTRIMGSSVTAAPEQYGFTQTDQRADLYALGATLIWTLTGSYDRDSLEETTVSPQLKTILRKCTAFSPDDRYPSAVALQDALSGRTGRARTLRRVAAACALAAAAGMGLVMGVLLPQAQSARTVEFPSHCLELAVRKELDRPLGEITYGDLEQVERLALVGNEVLEDPSSYFYYMNDMTGDTSRGDASDLSLLASMPNLGQVWLCRQQITDPSPLEGLPLTTLVLCDNYIEDLSPLSSLTGLNTLWLGGNTPSDLSPLAGLTMLRDLNLDGIKGEGLTPLDSLAPLAGLPLVRLSLGGRWVSDGDWSVLAQLPLLEEVSLWAPPEAAVAALVERVQLPILNVGLLPCEDLSILAGCQVVDLRLHAGQNTLEGAEDLPRLRNLGLFASNVADLSPLLQADLLETFCFTGSTRQVDFSVLSAGSPYLRILVPQNLVEQAEAACPGRVTPLG